MLPKLFDKIIDEWKSSYRNRFHPNKYVALSTIDLNGFPRSRTVAVREVHDNLDVIIFTDARSAKVDQLNKTPKACILACNHKKLEQLRWDGELSVIQDEKEVKRLFQKVGQKSLKDHTTVSAPGSAIKNPDEVEYLSRKESYFMALRFKSKRLEYLKLKCPNHLRALFT
ncbi:hypothetical protein BST97_14960 [Nonlabens spongiae]|uniref:Pyridoxamine 5'-phosphate oxidase Alr4036 family FMN-binding domain-containing protein n=1 Tax=Nonlabens spongiae TaxID=331648 RepID=A0A1W6MNY5_9FLAO|nr:pyridoxamine 5'-phosphate oxidase family protein [Nonlabens spongiae]ARN79179.1 hypothetical protein BST97_14960 [Nonlabens spongiae]